MTHESPLARHSSMLAAEMMAKAQAIAARVTNHATAQWEARFRTSGEDRARCSTWKLDALYFAAAREAYDRENANMRMTAARRLVHEAALHDPPPVTVRPRAPRAKRETAIERHLQRAGLA